MNENIYQNFKPASCLPDCWCEVPKVGQYILEPGNTWSNLAFIFCGLIILFYFKDFPRRKLAAVAFFSVGVGSMLFHGTQTFLGQTVDVLGMYMMVTFLTLYLWKKDFSTILWLGINSGLLGILWFYPEVRRWLFMAMVLGLVIYSIKRSIKSKYLYGSILSMILGQVVWNIDRLKIVCDPSSPISGHFFWHIFSASSALLFVQALRFNDRKTGNSKLT